MARTHAQTEAKQRMGDRVLQAAYARSGEMEPKMNGRAFFQFVPEVARLVEAEQDAGFEEIARHWGMFLEFIFAKGPAPDRACKRLYAIVWAVRRKLLLGMNIREVSAILGEVRASGSARVNSDFSDYLAMWGFRGTRVSGQKREGSRGIYAGLAEGNTSRKHGLKKGEKREPKPERRALSAAARRAIVKDAERKGGQQSSVNGQH